MLYSRPMCRGKHALRANALNVGNNSVSPPYQALQPNLLASSRAAMAPQVVRAELVAPAVARALAEQRGGQPRAGADGGFPAVRDPQACALRRSARAGLACEQPRRAWAGPEVAVGRAAWPAAGLARAPAADSAVGREASRPPLCSLSKIAHLQTCETILG